MEPFFKCDSIEVYHGDCLDVMAGFIEEGRVFDALISDPPYGSNDGGGKVTKKGDELIKFGEVWDVELPLEWLECVPKLLTFGGWCIAFTDKLSVNAVWKTMKKSGMNTKQTFYWVKNNPPPQPRKNFCSGVESAVCATNGPVKKWNGGGWTVNYIFEPLVTNGDRTSHPTQKPVNVMVYLIEATTEKSDLILDPFAGSGTTAIAALRTGRRCVLIEREREYIDIIVDRIERELKQPRLFTVDKPAPQPEQGELFTEEL